VVISPPDGSMAEYLASLRRLLTLDIDWLAPGHGFLMQDPHGVAQQLIDHRLAREAMIAAAWEGGARTLDELRAAVYRDLHPALHAMAQRSIRAHLIHLGHASVADALQ
jgi:glyoxylase-like metal-dependent hydrolase (beta-lactamase superfamily II)